MKQTGQRSDRHHLPWLRKGRPREKAHAAPGALRRSPGSGCIRGKRDPAWASPGILQRCLNDRGCLLKQKLHVLRGAQGISALRHAPRDREENVTSQSKVVRGEDLRLSDDYRDPLEVNQIDDIA